MDKKYINSLWDPICVGDSMFLFLSKNNMANVELNEDELLLKDMFYEYGNLKTL